MNNRALTVGLLGFGLLLGALIAKSGGLALMALPFLAYLGAGILAAPAREDVRILAERTLQTHQTGEGTSIEVDITLSNAGTGLLSLQLVEASQPGMQLTQGSLRQWLVLAQGETGEVQYTFQTARGNYTWKSLRALASDAFGLFGTALELPAGAEIQVQPRMTKIRPIPLRPESTLHSPGSIPAHMGGSGTDFWGVREYHPGDPLRRLDWRMNARHPGLLFTQEFEQEEVADIGLILDARHRMDLVVSGDSLLERNIGAAASLAEMFLHQGNRVSLLIFGDQMTTVYPGYSKAQLNRILRSLAKVRPSVNSSALSLGFAPLRMFSSRALIVILSPLAPGDWPLFPRLRAHGNQGLLICPNAIDFGLRDGGTDQAEKLAIRAARLDRHIELRKISALRIRVIDWQVDRPLYPLVRSALYPSRGQMGGR
ncbi:MAG TPA: DUF58 domain-containing protein [Anaerolineaceae bacterium]